MEVSDTGLGVTGRTGPAAGAGGSDSRGALGTRARALVVSQRAVSPRAESGTSQPATVPRRHARRTSPVSDPCEPAG